MDSLSFGEEDATNYLEVFLQQLTDSGVDINNKADFKKGIFKLFNIELYNMPDLERKDYILASNHVSDVSCFG